MIDRQALREQLLDYLQTPPPAPDYLSHDVSTDPAVGMSTVPELAAFDPAQMMAEWIALRHEVKQQNRLLQAAQTNLQRSLETEQSQNQQLQDQIKTITVDSATEIGTLKSELQQQQRDQKTELKDLLKIMDALDQASDYWQLQIDDLSKTTMKPAKIKNQLWQRIGQILFAMPPSAPSPANALKEMMQSNQQGIEVIQRSLLDLLRQRQVAPIVSMGQPFDPQSMYAIGRQESATVPVNCVIQEVVRGYMWHDQILREAQVMVAVKPA
jgi:molecular chaperone GrpE